MTRKKRLMTITAVIMAASMLAGCSVQINVHAPDEAGPDVPDEIRYDLSVPEPGAVEEEGEPVADTG